MATVIFDAATEADTDRLGAALAHVLPEGTVVALEGTLGAGKTRLVQAVAQALGVAEGEVMSPTFVLVKEYVGQKPVAHFDAYRLRDEDEFLELGPEEYFERPGLTFIEWASRVAGCLPAEHLTVTIDVTGEASRRFTLTGSTEHDDTLLERLRGELAA